MKLLDSKYNHIKWADIDGNGVAVEIAVMRQDQQGNIYYIRVDQLDEIDKRRLLKIVTNRNAPNFPLWDLMSNVVLGNGVNALEYFHQLVKVKNAAGQTFKPQAGQMGMATEAPTMPAETPVTGETTTDGE